MQHRVFELGQRLTAVHGEPLQVWHRVSAAREAEAESTLVTADHRGSVRSLFFCRTQDCLQCSQLGLVLNSLVQIIFGSMFDSLAWARSRAADERRTTVFTGRAA